MCIDVYKTNEANEPLCLWNKCLSESKMDTSEKQQECKVNNSALDSQCAMDQVLLETLQYTSQCYTHQQIQQHTCTGFKRFSGFWSHQNPTELH